MQSKELRHPKNTQVWIHRWSRAILAGIAALGVAITAYLTIASFSQNPVVCPTNSCNAVLASPYAKVFGLPLALFGLMGYIGMVAFAIAPLLINSAEQKELRATLEKWTWLLLFMGGTAMAVFSGYLMYLLFAVIQSACPYCIASALCSLSLFVFSIIGHKWEDSGQLFFTGTIIAVLTLVTTLGIYANANQPTASSAFKVDPSTEKMIITPPTTAPEKGMGWEITTTSGVAEIGLARHLKQIGAKVYVQYTCPHCFKQKQLFGKEALQELDVVECLPDGKNARPQLCEAAKITGIPTWEINGKFHQGETALEELADLSGYQGDRNFRYQLSR